MSKLLATLSGLFLFCTTGALAQRICGAELQKQYIAAHNPHAAEQLAQHRLSLQAMADRYKLEHEGNRPQKTTSAAAIPTIFHVIVDSAQFIQLGGIDGITHRCDSQIVVLNRDYNRQNADSALILTGFQPFYTSVGISFGLAHTDPDGYATPGYEIRIIDATGFNGAVNSYPDAKHTITGGLDAWDVNKYMNIWCINFLDFPGLIGLTVAKSFVDLGYNAAADEGICLTYNVFGSREAPTDSYPNHFDLGRSLTHEVGHFFEIWHPWGDDGGLCPSTGGNDDGIADTPPEANNASGSPIGPIFDACTPVGDGVMWMNYMDYCNDNAVHMFTIDQAAVMANQVATGGESYTLTQNPGLLNWGITSVSDQLALANGLNIFPNPATNTLNVTYATTSADLRQLTLLNVIGQQVLDLNVAGKQKNLYSIDVSAISKGIYFLRCNFASGNITRKIVLQ